MKNEIYIESNGVVMIESFPLNWERSGVYTDNIPPYFYSIYVGQMSGGYMCIYKEEENELSINCTSGEDPIVFKVDSIEDAGEIVNKFAKGMKVDLEDTIHEVKNYKYKI